MDLTTDVGGHNDNGVFEVYRPAVAVGYSAVVEYLQKQIELVNPSIIVCLGRIAAQRFFYPDFRITREHGPWICKDGVWITALYHPSALLRDLSKRPETFEDLLSIRKKLKEVHAQI